MSDSDGSQNTRSKRCPDCGLIKPALGYRRNTANPDGLGFYCRECQSGRKKESYRARRERAGKKVRERIEVPDEYKRCLLGFRPDDDGKMEVEIVRSARRPGVPEAPPDDLGFLYAIVHGDSGDPYESDAHLGGPGGGDPYDPVLDLSGPEASDVDLARLEPLGAPEYVFA